MKIVRQIYRGCTDLPHVGPHPGTIPCMFFILLGGVGGHWFGMVIMAIFILPLYFFGAYCRAEWSDRHE
jgi:uncharacterized membrane protein